MILSILISTIVFFAATYYLRRYMDNMDLPQGMTRNILVFSLALLASYVVATIWDHLFP